MGFYIQMSVIGDRLREERERMGLSQGAFGEIGGVKANAQGNYEKGDRSPGADYLASVAKVGVDVLYIITGRRLPAELDSFSQIELDVIGYLRDMSDDDRATFVRMAQGLSLVSKGR